MKFLQKNIVIFVLLFFVVSCSKTVRDHNEFFTNLTEPEGLPDLEETTTKMADRSLEELIAMGKTHLANTNYRLAGLHFATALEKKPDAVAAHVGLGHALLHSAAPGQANLSYVKALVIDPENIPALVALGRICRGRGDYNSAKYYFDKALAIDADDPEVMTELAITYDVMGQMNLAEPLYQKVRLLKENQAASYNNIGYNYLLQEKYQEAIKTLNHALNLQPANERTRNNLAAAYALSGKEQKALHILETTVGKAAAYNNLGYIYITQGEWAKAEKALKRALELNPQFYVQAKENLSLLQRKRHEAVGH